MKVSPPLIADDFDSVLQCIYAVRCNLIHGSKIASEQERGFVHIFSVVLEKLLNERNGLLSLR